MNDESEKKENEKGVKHGNKDLRARIICLLFAIVLWFYVVSTQTIIDERKFNAVPILMENENLMFDEQGNQMTLIEEREYKVDVVVTGTLGELNRLEYSDIAAYVDLSKVNTPGEQVLEVRTRVSGDVSVKGLSIGTVTVYADRTNAATYDIEVELLDWSKEADYEIGEPELSAQTVEVSGPLNILESIKCAKVGVNCGKLTNSIEVKGSIYLVDEKGNVVDNRYLKYKSDVTVKIPVVQTREITLGIKYKYGFHDTSVLPYTIVPSSITVKGDPAKIKRLEEPFSIAEIDETMIYGTSTVNGSAIDAYKYITEDYDIALPDGVEALNTSSAYVEFDLSNLKTKTVNVGYENVTVINNRNLSYDISKQDIPITLRASGGSLAMINDKNIKLEADISDFAKGAGNQIVKLNVIIPDELKDSVYAVGEYTTEINILN